MLGNIRVKQSAKKLIKDCNKARSEVDAREITHAYFNAKIDNNMSVQERRDHFHQKYSAVEPFILNNRRTFFDTYTHLRDRQELRKLSKYRLRSLHALDREAVPQKIRQKMDKFLTRRVDADQVHGDNVDACAHAIGVLVPHFLTANVLHVQNAYNDFVEHDHMYEVMIQRARLGGGGGVRGLFKEMFLTFFESWLDHTVWD